MSTKAKKELLEKINNDNFVNWGLLNTSQAKEFYETIVDESVFLKNARTQLLAAPSHDFYKIDINGRVVHPTPVWGNLDPANAVEPWTETSTLDTKKVYIYWFLHYDTLEDNIEWDNLKNTLTRMIGAAAANDIEDLCLYGNSDTDSPYRPWEPWADPLLFSANGFFNLVKDKGHNYDAGGAALSLTMFSDMLKQLPTKFRNRKERLRWYMSPNMEEELRSILQNRTTQLWDMTITKDDELKLRGIIVVPVPRMKDTDVILTYRENLINGVWRQMTMRSQEQILKDGVDYTITMRSGFQVQDADAVVFTQNIQPAS